MVVIPVVVIIIIIIFIIIIFSFIIIIIFIVIMTLSPLSTSSNARMQPRQDLAQTPTPRQDLSSHARTMTINHQ